jgi:hypothetical protein
LTRLPIDNELRFAIGEYKGFLQNQPISELGAEHAGNHLSNPPFDCRERLRATRGRELSDVIFVASLVFLALTLVLPTVKLPESENYLVSGSHVNGTTYQIEFYDVPPVDAGTQVNVAFSGFAPQSVQFALSPLQGDTLLRALAYGTVGAGENYSFSVVPNITASLRLLAVSFNGTGYNVQISSIWSPFYDLRVYTAPAVFLILASGLAAYYFRQRVPRQKEEERVMAELQAGARKSASSSDPPRT